MSDFKGQHAPNSLSAGTLLQTPLKELTALPQTFQSNLRGGRRDVAHPKIFGVALPMAKP